MLAGSKLSCNSNVIMDYMWNRQIKKLCELSTNCIIELIMLFNIDHLTSYNITKCHNVRDAAIMPHNFRHNRYV